MIRQERNRLGLDLSRFWEPHPTIIKFILRFKDLSEQKRLILAKRIKDTAYSYSIRKNSGPDIQKIAEALEEFNPIIFAEAEAGWIPYGSHQNFGVGRAYTLNGYNFKEVCKAVYKLTCLKRKLTKQEIKNIAFLTFRDVTKVVNFVDQNYQGTEPIRTGTQITEIPEIGMNDLEQIRRGLGGGIPSGMLAREEEPEITFSYAIRDNPRSEIQTDLERNYRNLGLASAPTWDRPPTNAERETRIRRIEEERGRTIRIGEAPREEIYEMRREPNRDTITIDSQGRVVRRVTEEGTWSERLSISDQEINRTIETLITE